MQEWGEKELWGGSRAEPRGQGRWGTGGEHFALPRALLCLGLYLRFFQVTSRRGFLLWMFILSWLLDQLSFECAGDWKSYSSSSRDVNAGVQPLWKQLLPETHGSATGKQGLLRGSLHRASDRWQTRVKSAPPKLVFCF